MSRIDLHLYRPQRRRLRCLLRKTKSRIEARRARILLLLHAGNGATTISEVVGCARATVYRTFYRWEAVGEKAVHDLRPLRAPFKLTPEAELQLVDYLDVSPRELDWHRSNWTLEMLAIQLDADTGIRISPSYVRVILRAHGCRRGRPRVALRIPVRGRRKRLKQIQRLVRRASSKREVFYSDEADIDLNPRLGSRYIKPRCQPLVLTPGKNKKAYIAGALNARTGRLVCALGARKNSALFVDLVTELRRRYRRAQSLNLILDNYIVHKSRYTMRCLQRFAGRILFHFLPPYSPEANVIERLWKQLHDHVTRNHQYQSLDDLLVAVVEFLELAQPFPGTQVSTAGRIW